MAERTPFYGEVSILVWYEGAETYRNVVEPRQDNQDADDRDYAEKDTAHWCLAASGSIDFAPTIPSECGYCHENTSNDVSYA